MHLTIARGLVLLLWTVLCLGLAPGALAAAGDWQPGPEGKLDNSYSGFVDVPVGGSTVPANQSVVVSGWVLDRTAQGWAGVDDLHVYDGLAGQGGAFLGRASFAQSRPDVAQALANAYWVNSGFQLNVSAGRLSAGGHTLTVYAHTPAKGWWSTQVSLTIGAATPPPAAQAPPVNVIQSPSATTINKSQNSYTIKGYALDPSATSGTGIDRVEVYMDELRGTSGSKSIGTADLGSSRPEAADRYGAGFMASGYQIDFKPSDFDAGNHHVYTYARSSLTGQETIAISGFDIVK